MKIYVLKLRSAGIPAEAEADILCSSFKNDEEALVATQRLFGQFIDDEAELHCVADIDEHDLKITPVSRKKTLVARIYRNKEEDKK